MAAIDPNYYNLRSRAVLKRAITNKEGKDDTKEALDNLTSLNDETFSSYIKELQRLYLKLFPKEKTDEATTAEAEEEEEEEEKQDDNSQTITIRFTIKNTIT
jgi:hypothetical protein